MPAAFLALVLAAPPRAAAADTVCVAGGALAGNTADALVSAVTIEQMKAGTRWSVVRAASLEACPTAEAERLVAISAGGPDRLVLRRTDGSSSAIDLQDVPPERRPREAARAVVALLTRPALLSPPPIVEQALPAYVPRRAVPAPMTVAVSPGQARAVRWYAGVAGALVSSPAQGRHGGEVAIEGAAVMRDERFTAGVRLAWAPPQAASGDVPARRQSVQAAATGSWRFFRARGIALGVAAATGAEWRWVTLSPPSTASRPDAESVVPFGEVGFEVVVPAGRVARMGATAWVRGYPYWKDLWWKARPAWEAPRWEVGVSVRAGALLPGGAR